MSAEGVAQGGPGPRRVLALDVGDVRVGLALSDELGLTAQPAGTLDGSDPDALVKDVAARCRAWQVGLVVVGLPRNMDGSEGPAAQKARRVIARLKQEVAVPVEEWDERLTTAAAERMLISADLSRRRRKQVVDTVAAVLILQSFLEARRGAVHREDEPDRDATGMEAPADGEIGR